MVGSRIYKTTVRIALPAARWKALGRDCASLLPGLGRHVQARAAVLYGVGARLDSKPELLFTLRAVDAAELVARAAEDLPLAKKAPAASRQLGDAGLAEMFGIEMAATAAPAKKAKGPPARRGK